MSDDSRKNDALERESWIAMIPAWLISFAAHLMLAICGSLVVSGLRSKEPTDEPGRAAEIVLARRDADRTQYFTDETGAERHEVLKPPGARTAGPATIGLGGGSES